MITITCIKHQINREIGIFFKMWWHILVILALKKRGRNRWIPGAYWSANLAELVILG